MLVSLTLTLMQGHGGSAKAKTQCWFSTTKHARSIKLSTMVGLFFTWPWLCKRLYGLTIFFTSAFFNNSGRKHDRRTFSETSSMRPYGGQRLSPSHRRNWVTTRFHMFEHYLCQEANANPEVHVKNFVIRWHCSTQHTGILWLCLASFNLWRA